MRITLAQLEALLWVSRLGTVQEAARHLNLTQPTVSLRLRDLSETLGKPMFLRSGRNIKLTVDALNILDHITKIIDETEKIIDKTSSDNIHGLVRMGISEAIALAGLSTLLTDLSQLHPNLRLEVTIGSSINLQQKLHEGALDLALGINLYEDDRIQIVPLGVQKAVWVTSFGRDLPDPITPSDVVHLPILINPSPTPMYRQTMNWFHSSQLEPQKISVSNSISVIAHLVKVDIGLAILPYKLVEPDIDKGLLAALRCKPALDHSVMSFAYRINDWRPSINAIMEVTNAILGHMNWLENL